MFDARPDQGTPVDLDKLRSISIGRRTRPIVQEGRQHPESGAPYKATTDELGNTTTEHATKDDRVDVLIRPGVVSQGLTLS